VLLKYQAIIKSLGNSFQTNASPKIITSLLQQQLNTLGSWQTESISVTGSDSHNSTYSMGSLQLYVMEPNVGSLNSAKEKIRVYER
jgi:anionic cell wall polymer biosynthesis LytR-Cps2A-Psr (LCP) family protein